MTLLLQGRKGGGDTPVEASDTLRSVQRAEIVDLLGEGQIGGLVNGRKSIYLDGVPVENADGSLNFGEFAHYITLGAPTGEVPHAFDDVASVLAVGVTVTQPLPVVRTISDPNVNAVRVTIAFPTLMEQKDNGDRVGASVEWAIEVQSNGGGYVERYRNTVTGKASATYPTAVRLELASYGPAPWDIRVRRITADSTSGNLIDAFIWQSYTAITSVRMLYRHTAAVWLTFDAKNFQSIPARAYDVMGISDWDIPANYNPISRVLTGAWNGTFTQGWTNNPAWVFYGLVQHPRYGLGQYVAQLPDKWTLYQLAQWCDAPVPNGRGGTEPRYTINAVVNTQVEALRLLQDIAAVFRGVMLYSGGSLAVGWDAPGSPVALFAPANVVDGVFSYSDGSRAAKKSSCTCWYNDLSQGGKRMPATWDDQDLIQKYGVRPMHIDPIGISSPSQALRMAKWALFTTELEDATVTFRVGEQGATGRVGEIFQVTDPAETGERLGGRIHSATTTQVVLDAPVVLVNGETYTLWVQLPDPDDGTRLIAVERAVTTGAGEHSTLDVSPAFPAAPVATSVWVLEANTVAPTLWRYVSITEVRNGTSGLQFEITGVRHVPDKWALIEANQPLTTRPTRRLTDAAPKPTGLTVDETIYIDQGAAKIRASVSWAFPAAGLRYVLSWRLDMGPWTTLGATSANTLDIDNLQPGELELRLHSVNALGNTSPDVELASTLDGKANPAPDVAGFAATTAASGVTLSWTLPAEGDYATTELRAGASWAAGTLLAKVKGSSYTWLSPAAGEHTAWAKHHDTSGNESATAASVTFTYTPADGGNFTDFIFKRAATQPATPTGNGTPATWSDAPPAADGNPLWASTALKTAANELIGVWSDPVRLEGDSVQVEYSVDGVTSWHAAFTTGDLYARYRVGTSGTWSDAIKIVGEDGADGTDGSDGESVEIQYSVDGSTAWHSVYSAGDLYARYRVGPAGTWSDAVKIVGEDGAAGDFFNYVFRRAATQPATPTGNGTPAGWSDSPPAADGNPLWASAARQTAAGVTQGAWSAPVKLTGDDGQKTALVYIYQRAASSPPLPTNNTTFSFTTGQPAGMNNGWQATVPGGSNPLWVTVASALGTGTTDTITPGEWVTPTILAQDGSAGATVATVYLYLRNTTGSSPALPSSTTTYTFATGQPAGMNNGWSATVPAVSGGKYLWVTTATAFGTGATDTILNSEWATPQILAQDGGAGDRGSLKGYSNSVSPPIYSAAPWNGFADDINARDIVWKMLGNGGSAPSDAHLRIGDTVTLKNSAGTASAEKFWSGSAWLDPGTVISGNLLVGGTISGGTNINITGFAKIEGNSSYLLNLAGSSSNYTVALVANTSNGAQIGMFGSSASAGMPGVYGYSTSGAGIGVLGYSTNIGVWGVGKFGVSGISFDGSGTGAGLYADAGPYTGNAGLKATNQNNTSNPAIQCLGWSQFTGQINSTVSTGFAPLVVASTTQVANLNVSYLQGATWASPGSIGATTPAAGRFSSLRVDVAPSTSTGGGAVTYVSNLPSGSAAATQRWVLQNFNGTNFWVPCVPA